MRNTYKWLYKDTVNIIENNLTLPPAYAELVSQLSRRYNIHILNIVFKKLENAHYAKKSCQLYVVYDGVITQSQKANISKIISLLFVEINKQYGITDDPNVLYLSVNMFHLDDISSVSEEVKSKTEKAQGAVDTAPFKSEKAKATPTSVKSEKPPEEKLPEKKTPDIQPEKLLEQKPPEKPPEKPSSTKNGPLFELPSYKHNTSQKPQKNKPIQKAPPSPEPPAKPYDRFRDVAFKLSAKKEPLSPIFKDLGSWLDDTYGIFAVNFKLIDLNPSSLSAHPVLEISFMNKESFLEEMPTEKLKDVKLETTKQFFILNRKYKICPDSNIKSFEVLFFNLNRHLRDTISKIAAENFEKFIRTVYSSIPIYKVVSFSGRTFIFFNKNKDLNKSEKTGMKSMLEDEYLNFLGKTDELGIFSPDEVKIIFSSRETIDKDFGGNEMKFCEGYSPT